MTTSLITFDENEENQLLLKGEDHHQKYSRLYQQKKITYKYVSLVSR